MIQIRQNVFETNSSSTHSICIAREIKTIPEKIVFHPTYAGRAEREISAPDYLYAAMAAQGREYFEEGIEIISDFLDHHNVEYTFEPVEWVEDWDYAKDCGVDHGGNARDFTDDVLNNESLLARFLFGDSIVYTGEYDDRSMTASEGEWIYDDAQDENGNWITVKRKNPYYHPEKYTYYFKED